MYFLRLKNSWRGPDWTLGWASVGPRAAYLTPPLYCYSSTLNTFTLHRLCTDNTMNNLASVCYFFLEMSLHVTLTLLWHLSNIARSVLMWNCRQHLILCGIVALRYFLKYVGFFPRWILPFNNEWVSHQQLSLKWTLFLLEDSVICSLTLKIPNGCQKPKASTDLK